ncbi:hypothetical protein PPSIR1_13875 [Plesiocystis pacifica SIR-1]|uniref:PpiC domain-containing protein n=1 Tax=Plesiocystis pacifica SIR-1 TaxID=391625 RepID=A6G8W0_9BACT|nr:peptidylprolyl isomerase [Plesiocystis pacifica]EDM77646.1 hypothetical protein PPSIR1_13875 [Plesiocystis pacifica SIR-1]
MNDPKPRRSLLQEPLLHFGALAVLVFVVQAFWGSEGPDASAEAGGAGAPAGPIVIDASEHQRLDREFTERYGRAPTDDEHQRLVDGAVERELMVREAFAMGLVHSDPMVRRRLLQKMEFVLGQASAEAPTLEELEAFYADNTARYAAAPRYDFTAVRVEAEDGPDSKAAAQDVRRDLAAGVDPKTLGDRVLRSKHFTPGRVSEQYGTDFTEALLGMEAKTWTVLDGGESWYVVRIDAIEARGEPKPFDAVRDRVQADWEATRRSVAFDAALDGLRARYAVEVEPRP